MADAEITEVKSQAQDHLLGLVIAGRRTLPNVTADQARALTTGLDVKALPEYVEGDPGFRPPTSRNLDTPPPQLGVSPGQRLAIAGGILAASRHQPQPQPQSTAPVDVGLAFTPPRHKHRPTQRHKLR